MTQSESVKTPQSIAEEYFQQFTRENAVAIIEALANAGPKAFEGSWLEFKAGGKLQPGDREKHWSKVLGGFANVEGGVLIWGIDAREKSGIDSVQGLDPVEDVNKFVSDLWKDSRLSLDPPLPGVDIKAVEIERGKGKGYVVCLVPQGKDQPYASLKAGKQYFMRTGESMEVIPRAVLQRLFFPTSNTEASLSVSKDKFDLPYDSTRYIRFTVEILNTGRYTIKAPCASVNGNQETLLTDELSSPKLEPLPPFTTLTPFLHPSMPARFNVIISDVANKRVVIKVRLFQEDQAPVFASFGYDCVYNDFFDPDENTRSRRLWSKLPLKKMEREEE